MSGKLSPKGDSAPPRPSEAERFLDQLRGQITDLEEVAAQVREAYGTLMPTFVARALDRQQLATERAREAARALERLL
jgi:hypothetical protein